MATLWLFLLFFNLCTLYLRCKYLKDAKHNTFWKIFAVIMVIISASMFISFATAESEEQPSVNIENISSEDDMMYVTEDDI